MELRSVLGGVRTPCLLVLLPVLYAACGGDSFTSEGAGGASGDASAGTGGADTGGTGGTATGGTGGTATGGTGGTATGGTGGTATGGTGGTATGGTGGTATGGTGGTATGGTGGTGGTATGGTGGTATGGTGGTATGGTGGTATGGTGGTATGGTGGAETGGTGGSATGGTGGGCDPDQKWCDNACVESNDPDFGCDAATCDPCSLPHVTEHACDATGCAISVCEETWGDCDDEADSGCEQGLKVLNHCGGCDVACVGPDHGSATCVTGTCIKSCDATYTLCGDTCVSLANDPKNCGWCGHDCGANNACNNGFCSPQVLHTSSLGALTDLAVDPGGGDIGSVYWAEGGSENTIKHRTKASSTVVTDHTSASVITTFTIDGTYLFVGTNDNSILRTLRVPSSPPDIQITTSGTPIDLHQNATAIGWAQASADPGIFTALKTTGVVSKDVVVASYTLRFPRLEPASKTLYYVAIGSSGTSSSFIGVDEPTAMTVERIAENLPAPGGLAMNGDSLFWTIPSEGKVHTVAKANPGLPEVIGGDVLGVEVIEADGDFVAWAQRSATPTGGKIVGRYGTSNRTLAQGEQSVCAIALDKDFVYWINCKAQGSVKRVAR